MNPFNQPVTISNTKIENAILKALNERGICAEISRETGIGEGVLSRFKSGDEKLRLGELTNVLSMAGLKVVPANYKCVDPEYAHSLTTIVSRVAQREQLEQLLWDDPE